MSQSLRSIRLFVATYEELSFTVAAQRENPNVSVRVIDSYFGDLTLYITQSRPTLRPHGGLWSCQTAQRFIHSLHLRGR